MMKAIRTHWDVWTHDLMLDVEIDMRNGRPCWLAVLTTLPWHLVPFHVIQGWRDLVCRVRGHRYDEDDSYFGLEGAAEYVECSRCGDCAVDHIYF